jgi:hypothetical protein
MKKNFSSSTLNRSILFFITITLLNNVSHGAEAKEGSEHLTLPLIQHKDVTFMGAFRLPLKEAGDSRIAYAEGTFTLSDDAKSFFVVGHSHHQAIAEMSIPAIVESKSLDKLEMAKIVQPYKSYLKKIQNKRKEKLDKITGLEYVEGQLWVNAVEKYDANANERLTSFIVRDAQNLADSKLSGLYSLKGRAHAAGWVSEVPKPWRAIWSSDYLTGYASNVSINSRLSIGPTAFLFHPFTALTGDVDKGFLPTTPLLDFSLKHPLHSDRYNDSGENDLWTEVSEGIYGFIIPDTNTYFVIGNSGGHKGGIGYKVTQDNGKVCGGPCSKIAKDNYNYYWLWKVDELNKTKNDGRAPYSHKPYEYGYFDKSSKHWKIIGADFHSETNRLFVLYAHRDYKQSKYENAPLMVVYKINQH